MKISIDQALKEGAEAFAEGKLKLADQLWTAAIKSAPDNPFAIYSMGSLAASVGAFEEAEPLLSKAIDQAPQNAAFWYKYMDLLSRTDQRKKLESAIASASSSGIKTKVLNEITHRTRRNKKKQQSAESQAISKLRTLLKTNRQADMLKTGVVALESESPGSEEVLYLMGIANASLRRFDESIYCYQRAIAVDPNHDRAHFGLISVLMELRELDAVQELLKNAMEQWPKDPRPYVLMGNLHRIRNKQEFAIESYRRALEFNPHHDLALNNIGTCLADLGDPEAAKQYYLKALESNPAFARAHRHLSALHKYIGEESQLATMIKLIENATTSLSDKIELGFGLSKAYQDLGIKEVAFNYLKAANQRQKQVTNYNLKSDIELYRRIRDVSKLDANDESHKIKGNHEPVFIVGMPRSGTTLVEQILSSHSAVHAGGELGSLLTGIRKIGILSNQPASEHIVMLKRFYLDELEKLSVSTPLITDKSPLNLRWLDLIFKMNRNSKVIHVQRDPRAVCWSCFNHFFPAGGYGFIYDPNDLVAYYEMYRELMETWREKYPERVYELNYEALTSDQEAESRKLLDYVGLPWEEGVLRFYENENVVRTSSSQQIRQPIFTDSSNKWRDYESFLQEMFDSLEGYVTS